MARLATAIGLALAALPAVAATPLAIAEMPTVPGSAPSSITAGGSPGVAYFTDFANDKIGVAHFLTGLRATEDGSPLAPARNVAIGIAVGPAAVAPDAYPSVWATVSGTTPAIVQVDPSTGTTVRSFPLGGADDAPGLIALGPDGSLWFPIEPRRCSTPCNAAPVAAIGRITPEGALTRATAGLVAGSAPLGIAAGPDGALWFTDPNAAAPAIGRVTTEAAPGIVEFTNAQSPGLSATSVPVAITADAEGHLWFTDQSAIAPAIGRITPAAIAGELPTIIEFPLPSANSVPVNIALGPDGNIWFTDPGDPNCGRPAIGRITPDGASLVEFPIAEFSGGTVAASHPEGIIGAASGSILYADSLGAIGQVTIPTDSLTVTVNGISGDLVTSTQAPGVTGVLALAHIECDHGGGACAAAFPDTTTVTLTATPVGGETFTGWSGAGASAGGCTTALVCAVPLTGNADSAITASFAPARFGLATLPTQQL